MSLYVIGLTGGIGTGKSTVAEILASLGGVLINADEEGHRAYQPGTIGWRRVLELFGSGILNDNGEIDRRRLGQLVFSDPNARGWLNAAIHPLIRQRLEERLRELETDGTEVAVIEAALLLQAGWNDLADEVWVVTAPRRAVMERLARERGMSREDMRQRISAQEPERSYTDRADEVIDNTGDREALREKVKALWKQRISLEGSAEHGRNDTD